MGEVYRADDLKLGQPVALKFLSHRAGEEQRLYDEVRVGRQVSHPNVCRLHDIAEVNGQLFITMEFVDGEDLASLLRRVGRLPPEKGLAISREICAGLAAAHDKGVIHRDLKPGNVMIDGHGRARITDFGLAVSQDQERLRDSAGTPAYMAPEQLSGAPASMQSDLYALGLTIYEVFTGKRAFSATSIHDLIARQRALDLTRPTSLVRDLDPAIERLITHCLEPDPHKRPASAGEVLLELPGGDPLAAAVAAGETPSPAMVAAAAERGDLSARTAWSALALFATALLVFAFLTPKTMFHHRARILKSPQVLEERAHEVLAVAGHRLAAADAAYLFMADLAQMEWTRTHPSSGVEPMPFHFLYRQSPAPMRSLTLEQRIDANNPPLSASGMANVQLDSAGRLVEIVVVPPQLEDPPAARRPMNWAPLMGMTGLPHTLREVPSRWAAPVDSDEKAAWAGADGSVRVEAAAYHGRPVWFSVIRPWNGPERMPPSQPKSVTHVPDLAIFSLLLVWLGVGLLGLRNLRRARVDRRGALRVAMFVFFTCALALTLRAHHIGGMRELAIVGKLLAYSVTLGSATWFAYVAVEPLVRRRWPRMLIGWSRLLAGQFRDPMVGRDLLIGVVAGILVQLVRAGTTLTPGASPLVVPPSAFTGLSEAAHWIVLSVLAASFRPLGTVAVLLAFAVVTRSTKATVIIGMLVTAASVLDSFDGPQWVRIPAALFVVGIGITLLFRLGILAVAATTFSSSLLMNLPITLDASSWYFGRSLFGILLLAAVAVYGFVTSLGGKRFLPDLAVES